MVYRFFYKKSADANISSGAVKSEIIPSEHPLDLTEELHKPITRQFEKRKVYSSFKDIIWGTDLADMQLISKFSKGFWLLLLCVMDVYSKYAWVVPLKDKRGATTTNALENFR